MESADVHHFWSLTNLHHHARSEKLQIENEWLLDLEGNFPCQKENEQFNKFTQPNSPEGELVNTCFASILCIPTPQHLHITICCKHNRVPAWLRLVPSWKLEGLHNYYDAQDPEEKKDYCKDHWGIVYLVAILRICILILFLVAPCIKSKMSTKWFYKSAETKLKGKDRKGEKEKEEIKL